MSNETEVKALAEVVAFAEGSVDDPAWDPVADLLADRLREIAREQERSNSDRETTQHGRHVGPLLTGNTLSGRDYRRTPPIVEDRD